MGKEIGPRKTDLFNSAQKWIQTRANQQIMSLIALVLCLGFGFQNCSKGFTKVDPSERDVLASSQCVAKLGNDRFNSLAIRKALDCGDLANYSCSISIFSPSVENGQDSGTVCEIDPQIAGCLNIKSYSFNTSSGLESQLAEDQAKFEVGGEYNREDIRCRIHGSQGEVLKTIVSESYAQGIKALVQDCNQRSGNDFL